MLCLVKINNLLFNLLCVWILEEHSTENAALQAAKGLKEQGALCACRSRWTLQ